MASIYDFTVATIDGQSKSLAEYRGKVLLIVNVASRCGFTPQYEGLQRLFEKYSEQGLVVLGFPCNQFGGQEPGDGAEIKSFCEQNFHVSFPLFEKIDVNGENTHPLYEYLKCEARGLLGSQAIKWNFTKFLVARDGRVVKRFAPKETPEGLEKKIVALLSPS